MKKVEKNTSKKEGEKLTASNVLLMYCHVRTLSVPRNVRQGKNEGGSASIFMDVNAAKRDKAAVI